MTLAFQAGDITIQRIVESDCPHFNGFEFFPSLSRELFAEHAHWLVPKYFSAEGMLNLCIQSYLVRTRHHTILVDTCVGNHKPRKARAFWDQMNSDLYQKNLAAAGVAVEDIDYVMCTHLHTDHVGWNTRLENGRWVPTFPNARYVMAERELAHWTERHAGKPEAFPWITDSVLPIVAAGKAEVVKSDHALGDVVQLVPSPGHSFDHFSVLVGKAGADALLTGDMIHSPIQARYPEIGMMSDWSSEQAGKSRRGLLERFCDTGTLWCTAHFPAPSTGRA
jgi:glyoxylase-like metal-dependent hydrolase (beta-lactamase superfamily II)